ncbi:GAF domain-containing protein [Microvirga aerophila]|nr:GAF domain-containing protein [Microvirga aerophila]
MISRALGGSQDHRYLCGVRSTAIIEIFAFLAAMLLLDWGIGGGSRFADVSPHPFWIIVLLASSYYGTSTGLAAAALSAGALLIGNLPEQGFGEDHSAWLLRISAEPVLWAITAVTLGEIHSRQQRVRDELKHERDQAREAALSITQAYENLTRITRDLEVRVASQAQTIHTTYLASRAIDQQTGDDVLAGVADFIQSIMAPKKFSLFLLNNDVLEMITAEGWVQGDTLRTEIDKASPLYEEIVSHRRILTITDPKHETSLAGQGLLAGPLVNAETNQLIGMLKIEELKFADLNPSTLHNFQLACDWIGMSFTRARRVEQFVESLCVDSVGQILPATLFDRQRALFAERSQRSDYNASVLFLRIESQASGGSHRRATIDRAIQHIADRVLPSSGLRFSLRGTQWDYAILLPDVHSTLANDLGQRFMNLLKEESNRGGQFGEASYLVETVHQGSLPRADLKEYAA